jgi:histidinol-phosphatase
MLYRTELSVARDAAVRAGEKALRYWRQGVDVETKPDDSPVSEADRDSERMIVEHLTNRFPEDGLVGEEGAHRQGTSGRRWIIDPVDGTRDFVRGSRQWAGQIALEDGRDNVVVGVVHFPAIGETYFATRDGGAFCDDKRIHVSAIDDVSRAVLCVNDLGLLAGTSMGERFLSWAARFWCVRNPSGSADAMLVASGRADAWFEPNAKEWDMAPHKVITQEAGGVFRNFDGGSSIYAGNCITCTPALEAELAAFVAGDST